MPMGDPHMTTVNPSAPTQLRRATYVHVSDLTGVYDIDHAKLEAELARVKIDSESPNENANAFSGVPTDVETGTSQKRLQPPRAGFNLCVLVGNVQVVVDKFRVDGSKVRLAEVDVGDETGMVSLRARDEQIDTLREVSARSGAVVLRNCTLELYQGKHIRLSVTKWGKLSPYPDQVASTPPPPSKMNADRNFSLIDLSEVASDHNSSMHEAGRSNSGHGRSQSFNRNRGGRRPLQQKPMGAMMQPMQFHGGMHYQQGGLHGYGSFGLEGPNQQAYGYRMTGQPGMTYHQYDNRAPMPYTAQPHVMPQVSSPMMSPAIPSGSPDGSMTPPPSFSLSGQGHGSASQQMPPLSFSRSESPATLARLMNPNAASFDPNHAPHAP